MARDPGAQRPAAGGGAGRNRPPRRCGPPARTRQPPQPVEPGLVCRQLDDRRPRQPGAATAGTWPVVETERQVEAHLDEHLQVCRKVDLRSRAILHDEGGRGAPRGPCAKPRARARCWRRSRLRWPARVAIDESGRLPALDRPEKAGMHRVFHARATGQSTRLRLWYSSSISRLRRASIFMRSLKDRLRAPSPRTSTGRGPNSFRCILRGNRFSW